MRRGLLLLLLLLVAYGAVPAASGTSLGVPVNETVDGSDTSPAANATPGEGDVSPRAAAGEGPALEYRDTNASSMHYGRTMVADFRPSSIAVHDWLNVYNPSNETFTGEFAISLPEGAEVAKVANEKGTTLEYSSREGRVAVKNISIPPGGSLLIGIHYDVIENSLNFISDRYTEEMALVMRARGGSEDQFDLQGPLQMRGLTGNQEGRSEFLATAEELKRGVELGVRYAPSEKPVGEEQGEKSLSDIYLAVGVALAMVAVLVYSIKGELGIPESMFPSMRGGSPSMGREGRQFCPECGTRSDGVFCPSCGNEIAENCPGCGSDLEPGASFCGACGEPVSGGGPGVST